MSGADKQKRFIIYLPREDQRFALCIYALNNKLTISYMGFWPIFGELSMLVHVKYDTKQRTKVIN